MAWLMQATALSSSFETNQVVATDPTHPLALRASAINRHKSAVIRLKRVHTLAAPILKMDTGSYEPRAGFHTVCDRRADGGTARRQNVVRTTMGSAGQHPRTHPAGRAVRFRSGGCYYCIEGPLRLWRRVPWLSSPSEKIHQNPLAIPAQNGNMTVGRQARRPSCSTAAFSTPNRCRTQGSGSCVCWPGEAWRF